MNIDFDYYKVFCYVAKYKKMSVAAEKLFVSQPAITQTIQNLENQLGCVLLMRTKNGIELTEAGMMLYELTEQSVETLDNIEFRFEKYKNLEEGKIRIRTGGTVAKLILYNAMEKFSKDYPNIEFEIATDASTRSIKMLYTGELDMILAYLPFNIEYDNMQITECREVNYVFAMSKTYNEQNNVKIEKLEDLNNYPLILPKKNSAIREIFDKKYKKIITNCHYEIAQEQMKKEFIMRNMGIGFIIEDEIKKELENGELIKIDIEDSTIRGAVGAIIVNKNYSTYATKKLLEYLKNE